MTGLRVPYRDGASYRDPSGFVFWVDGEPYRQINAPFADDWRAFSESGLYAELLDRRLIIEHKPAPLHLAMAPGAAAVIQPRRLAFVSYPYEWSFPQLKDAALLTLEAQETAVRHGMTLRDASAFNVQFEQSRPILIDSLSFQRLGDDATWMPYRQFCEHFLTPLALMAYDDPKALLFMRTNVDGIPLNFARRLLPYRSRLNVGLLAHVHLHARAPSALYGKAPRSRAMGVTRLLALIDGLRRTIDSLRLSALHSTWSEYTPLTSYSAQAHESKESIVRSLLSQGPAGVVWGIGANDGHYSRIAAEVGHEVIALDADATAVAHHYEGIRGTDQRILPLVMDVVNPTPALGWNGHERLSIFDRANADVVTALALMHHLAIGRNIPFEELADFFARLGRRLLLEWVPKDDPMAQKLLASRKDVFPDYTLESLRTSFAARFEIAAECPIADSRRIILDLRRR